MCSPEKSPSPEVLSREQGFGPTVDRSPSQDALDIGHVCDFHPQLVRQGLDGVVFLGEPHFVEYGAFDAKTDGVFEADPKCLHSRGWKPDQMDGGRGLEVSMKVTKEGLRKEQNWL